MPLSLITELYLLFLPCQVRAKTVAGMLPIHSLFAFRWWHVMVPATADDKNDIKLLVANWPDSANIPSGDPSDPDSITMYDEARTRGLTELQRFILRLCPA
jgi:hypothetical protein